MAIVVMAPAAYGFTQGQCPTTPGREATVMWGGNGRGELAIGWRGSHENTPRTAPKLTNVRELDPGFQFSVAILGDCEAVSWGSNFKSGLGDGIPHKSTTEPVPVAYAEGHEHGELQPLKDLKQVSVSKGPEPHVVALQYNGTVWTWGAAEFGERGNGEKGFEPAAKVHEPAIARPRYEPIPLPLTEVEQVASGGTRDYALRNGEVLAWGGDGSGELGYELPAGKTELCNGEPAPSVSVPCSTHPGAVQIENASTHELEALKGVEKIAAGNGTGYAVRNKTEIIGWGENIGGELLKQPEKVGTAVVLWSAPSQILEVAPGQRSVFVRLKNGEVWGWGTDAHSQLGVAPEGLAETCGGRKEKCTRTPLPIPSLTHVLQLVTSEDHSFALKEEAEGKRVIYSFGGNGAYELLGLGHGLEGPGTQTWIPEPIEGLASVAHVSTGATIAGALLEGAAPPPAITLTPSATTRAAFLIEWTSFAEAYSIRWHKASSRKYTPPKEQVCPAETFCGGHVETEELAPSTYDFVLSRGPAERSENGEAHLNKKTYRNLTIAAKPEPPAGAPAELTPPSLPELAQIGYELKVTPGTWKNNPTSIKYEWLHCEGFGAGGSNESFGEECEAIPGATGPTYTPTENKEPGNPEYGKSYVGQTLVVVEKAENSASGKEKPTEAESEPVVVRGLAKDEGRESEPTNTEYPPRVPPAPENTAAPHITSPLPGSEGSSKAVEGQTLTLRGGEWTNEPLAEPLTEPLSHAHWYRCKSATAEQELASGCGAIFEPKKEEKEAARIHEGPTYETRPEDMGQYIEVQETAGNSGGRNLAISNPIQVEAPNPPEGTKGPGIEVETVAQVDQKLNAVPGEWTNDPTSVAYQWERCSKPGTCVPIMENEKTKGEKPANKENYKIESTDIGSTLRVSEDASNKVGTSAWVSSPESSVVPSTPKFPEDELPPKVSGTAVEGQTLTLTPGKWHYFPDEYNKVLYEYPKVAEYTWLRCAMEEVNGKLKEVCHGITGASGTTYTLGPEDVHKKIKVREYQAVPGDSGKRPNEESVESIGPVEPAAPESKTPPVIQGYAKQGQQLTVNQGTWTNAPTEFAYQWLRCKEGLCENITGATGTTYVLGQEDVGRTLELEETATGEGKSTSKRSAQTKEVLPHEPVTEGQPTITGSPVRGDLLTANGAVWKYGPTKYTYQWERCSGGECEAISGATAQTYTTATADVGETIRVVETASNAGGYNREVSEPTGTVTVPAPVVAKIEPARGPEAGRTVVTITGEHLEEATAVEFGSPMQLGTVKTDSPTTLTVEAPAGTGQVAVTVTTRFGGTSSQVGEADEYTYVSEPAVTAVSPNRGKPSGGETVMISGADLEEADAVSFGSTSATSFHVLSATSIEAVAPAGTGTVEVSVTTPYGTSPGVEQDDYTYVPTPVITKIEPAKGPIAGKNIVTIRGEDLEEATGVEFGFWSGKIKTDSPTAITVEAPAGSGMVAVTVTTRVGGAGEAGEYTYVPPPAVTAVSPNRGRQAGAESVVISGENLAEATAVSFGSAGAASFHVLSATSIEAVAPAGTGTVGVSVTTPYGTSAAVEQDAYTFVAAPTITKVEPGQGGEAGGTRVTITGTGFEEVTSVTVGGAAATSVETVSPTTVKALTPAGTGTAQVVVSTHLGGSSNAGTFSYLPAPVVTKVSPTSGPTTGGTPVTITGKNFSGATAVYFGTTAAETVTVESATKITVSAPAGAAGEAEVTVTTPNGTSEKSSKEVFKYTPTITGVTPTSGPTTGGKPVTITGTGFAVGATTIKFGGLAATSVTCASSTECTAISPKRAGAGTVEIVATVNGESNPKTAAADYTYE